MEPDRPAFKKFGPEKPEVYSYSSRLPVPGPCAYSASGHPITPRWRPHLYRLETALYADYRTIVWSMRQFHTCLLAVREGALQNKEMFPPKPHVMKRDLEAK